MSRAEEQYNPYQAFGLSAADAAVDERVDFIRKTYLHLAGAVLLFAGVCAIGLQMDLGIRYCEALLKNPLYFIGILLGVMVVGWVCQNWVANPASIGMQYAGLIIYAVAEAILFMPILYVAENSPYIKGPVIQTAGVATLAIFGALTVSVFLTRADFSFLRTGLTMGMVAALGLIVCSWIFGFSLGLVFSIAMVVLAAGYILYYTSNVLHHYPVGFHVAAALALFAALALLFWYVLRIAMYLYGRD